jgi:hypothetical protein
MDNRCLGDVCKSLETQSPEKAAECVKSKTIDEDIDGCKPSFHLPRFRDFLSELENNESPMGQN